MVLFFQISQKSPSIEVVSEKDLIVAYEIEKQDAPRFSEVVRRQTAC